jgi:hypothetical protein
MYMCIYIYIYICVCVCVCVFTHARFLNFTLFFFSFLVVFHSSTALFPFSIVSVFKRWLNIRPWDLIEDETCSALLLEQVEYMLNSAPRETDWALYMQSLVREWNLLIVPVGACLRVCVFVWRLLHVHRTLSLLLCVYVLFL